MKAFTTVATLAALLSASYAATVTLEETPCLQEEPLETFTIETDKLVVKELKTVCGLKITKADGADINAISCQAYKDAEGKELGSARFTFAQPALIATNPVQEGSIRCDTTGNSTTTTGATATTLGTAVSSGTGVPTPSGNATVPSATQTPSAPAPTATPPPGSAGSQVTMSAAAIAVAFALFLL